MLDVQEEVQRPILLPYMGGVCTYQKAHDTHTWQLKMGGSAWPKATLIARKFLTYLCILLLANFSSSVVQFMLDHIAGKPSWNMGSQCTSRHPNLF